MFRLQLSLFRFTFEINRAFWLNLKIRWQLFSWHSEYTSEHRHVCMFCGFGKMPPIRKRRLVNSWVKCDIVERKRIQSNEAKNVMKSEQWKANNVKGSICLWNCVIRADVKSRPIVRIVVNLCQFGSCHRNSFIDAATLNKNFFSSTCSVMMRVHNFPSYYFVAFYICLRSLCALFSCRRQKLAE